MNLRDNIEENQQSSTVKLLQKNPTEKESSIC